MDGCVVFFDDLYFGFQVFAYGDGDGYLESRYNNLEPRMVQCLSSG